MRMMNQMSSNENLGTEEDAQTVSVDEGEVVKEIAGEEGEEDDDMVKIYGFKDRKIELFLLYWKKQCWRVNQICLIYRF